jgi:hypothetical protein
VGRPAQSESNVVGSPDRLEYFIGNDANHARAELFLFLPWSPGFQGLAKFGHLGALCPAVLGVGCRFHRGARALGGELLHRHLSGLVPGHRP